MTSESRFKSATLAKFGAMRSRCQTKGRMLRAPIPFTLTLDQFRGWCLEQFKSTEGVARCAYCSRPVNIETFSPDHKTALQRGGTSGLENLAVSCGDCNQIKGAMSADCFLDLIACLRKMPAADANSVTGRLLKSEKLASLTRRNFARAKAAKQSTAAQPEMEQDDAF